MSSTTLSIRVDDDQRHRLEELSRSTGRSRSFLAADAIREYLDANEWQVASVKAAIRSIDEAGGVPHGKVRDRVDSWGRRQAVSRPRPRKA